VGCNITLNTRREAKAGGDFVVKRVMPRQNEEVNEIWICDKGRFVHHYTDSKKRLEHPLVRNNEQLTHPTWDEATKAAADRLQPDLVILASGKLANEDLFNLKSLADQTGGKAYLYSHMAGGEMTTRVGVGADTNFGAMGAETAIVIVASDLYEEAPVWYLRVKQAADRGATLIVLNPRETRLDRFASYVVRYAYGDEVKAVQDLNKGKIGDALSNAQNVVLLFGSEGLGVEGTANLASACSKFLQDAGHVGKPNNGLIGVWERANDQGAWEMEFEVPEDLAVALRGKAVYIVGADPVGDDPQLADALGTAACIVVQDVMRTATTDIADIVLPARPFTEREGTLTSGERRVQRFYAAVPSTGESRADFVITAQIAGHMGIELESSSPTAAFERLAASVKSFAALTYARVSEVKPQWPIVGRGDMYYGGTTYENTMGLGAHLATGAGQAETSSLPKAERKTPPRPKENELLAVPVNKLYDRGTTVMMSANLLRERIGSPTISLHPDAAKNLGVESGELVNVSFDGVSGEARVKLDNTISVGVVLVPREMGFAIREPIPAQVSVPAKVE
jgi:NADH-quinone oxidoreductase subunit G